MKIQVAGPGCPKCQTTEKILLDALAELSMNTEVTHVTDYRDMARLGVRLTPAIVIDGEIALAGRVPTLSEAKDLLQNVKLKTGYSSA
jgi:small redox-active disulfide protein 2